ncbi:unnamed protein product [Boreogadus saida]
MLPCRDCTSARPVTPKALRGETTAVAFHHSRACLKAKPSRTQNQGQKTIQCRWEKRVILSWIVCRSRGQRWGGEVGSKVVADTLEAVGGVVWRTKDVEDTEVCRVLSALMTHISYLQSLDNPGSAGSGTNDFFQTPDESGRVRKVVRGMGKIPQ